MNWILPIVVCGGFGLTVFCIVLFSLLDFLGYFDEDPKGEKY